MHCLYKTAFIAGWSSPVARQAHNLKVVGSNPAPATNKKKPVFRTGFFFLNCAARVEPAKKQVHCKRKSDGGMTVSEVDERRGITERSEGLPPQLLEKASIKGRFLLYKEN